MPNLIVLSPRLSREKKAACARALTEAFEASTGIDRQHVVIHFEEHSYDNVAVGGSLLTDIDPELADYAELIQGLRRGSRLSADFITMLGLASVVASMGLLQDSPAVVIGSMLLAPLMTPMIGCGLALAQGEAEKMLSTLTPRTWVPASRNRARRSSTAGTSRLQVGVKSRG